MLAIDLVKLILGVGSMFLGMWGLASFATGFREEGNSCLLGLIILLLILFKI